MKILVPIVALAAMAAAPSLMSPPPAGDGYSCIDENPNKPQDCEVIYTGSGTAVIEICVTNIGCDNSSPAMTIKFDCADGAPADLTIGTGETKCGTCKIKTVTACDSDPNCEPCGEYTTTVPVQ